MLYKGAGLFFPTNYSKVVTKIYCALKLERILNLTIFSSLVFSNFIISGRHVLNISRTTFLKLIFYLQLGQFPDVLFREFYTHSMYVINHCI